MATQEHTRTASFVLKIDKVARLRALSLAECISHVCIVFYLSIHFIKCTNNLIFLLQDVESFKKNCLPCLLSRRTKVVLNLLVILLPTEEMDIDKQ